MDKRKWIRVVLLIMTAMVAMDAIFWHDIPRQVSLLVVLSFLGTFSWVIYDASRRSWAGKKPVPRRHPTIRPNLP